MEREILDFDPERKGIYDTFNERGELITIVHGMRLVGTPFSGSVSEAGMAKIYGKEDDSGEERFDHERSEESNDQKIPCLDIESC